MKYIKIFLIVVIVGGLLYLFLKDVDLPVVMNLIKQINPIYPIVFFIGLFLQYFIRSYRWGLLLKRHKKKINIFSLYNYTVIGYLINILLPGRLGEPARGILLADEQKISRSSGLASILLERLIDASMIVLIFLASLIFIKGNHSKFLVELKHAAFIAAPIFASVFVLFYLVNTGKALPHVEKAILSFAKIFPAKKRTRVASFLIDFIKSLRLNLGVWESLRLFFTSIWVWLFYVPFYWFMMQGFEFGSRVNLVNTIPYFGIIVLGATVPTPGMAGTLDAASRHGLEKLYGAETNPAAAYTLLVHFLIIAAVIIPGLIALWTKGLNLKIIKNLDTKTNTDTESPNINNEDEETELGLKSEG
ncbi:MAG TPA: lysylphosphatidylglycerol synthase transmembrane domain-containing protein [Candidatus Deferrimicrobium sp.]|nr:lysylphosphatidylglycerol synthase transmembrane domain-containing protein [Candidatus Deferrimicrobium sp.]